MSHITQLHSDHRPPCTSLGQPPPHQTPRPAVCPRGRGKKVSSRAALYSAVGFKKSGSGNLAFGLDLCSGLFLGPKLNMQSATWQIWSESFPSDEFIVRSLCDCLTRRGATKSALEASHFQFHLLACCFPLSILCCVSCGRVETFQTSTAFTAKEARDIDLMIERTDKTIGSTCAAGRHKHWRVEESNCSLPSLLSTCKMLFSPPFIPFHHA